MVMKISYHSEPVQPNNGHSTDKSIFLSIVISLFDEEESLEELHQQILDAITNNGIVSYEIIYINDGSTDNSLNILKVLQSQNTNVQIVNFPRNQGKTAALKIGFKLCRGDYVVTMDADLQDDPKEINALLELSKKDDIDVISGWKKKRFDSLEKRLPSKFFNYVTSLLGGIKLHDFNCGLKLYKKKVVKTIYHSLYGEMHRFIPLLAHWSGFKVGEMVVVHRARKHGRSKFGLARYYRGFIDLLTLTLLKRYKSRPMHVFGGFGTVCLLSGMAINFYFLGVWIVTGALHVRPIMILGIVLVVVALQFYSLGFISEIINQKNPNEIEFYFEQITQDESDQLSMK